MTYMTFFWATIFHAHISFDDDHEMSPCTITLYLDAYTHTHTDGYIIRDTINGID